MLELKPCPFCGCAMRLQSNHDWHRVMGDHAEECVFMDNETMMVPATDEQRDLAVAYWNKRAIPADQVLVPRETLQVVFEMAVERLQYQIKPSPSDEAAVAELRALLQL